MLPRTSPLPSYTSLDKQNHLRHKKSLHFELNHAKIDLFRDGRLDRSRERARSYRKRADQIAETAVVLARLGGDLSG